MKKGKIKLAMESGVPLEVDAEIVSEQWAVHQAPELERKLYVLTHIPSGKRVWSSRLKTRLKMLAQEPEFMEELDDTSYDDTVKIANAINRFCNKNTDLNAKPKKIGWD